MICSILILVGVILVISKLSSWKSHIKKEFQLLQDGKPRLQFDNVNELTRAVQPIASEPIAPGPIASWTIDHWENSENLASDIDDVMVIQNELGKIEKIKSKRLPQVICVGSRKCGTGWGFCSESAWNVSKYLRIDC